MCHEVLHTGAPKIPQHYQEMGEIFGIGKQSFSLKTTSVMTEAENRLH